MAQPRYWIIENVKGAIKYFGRPVMMVGPFALWGFFPPIPDVKIDYRKKETLSSSRSEERAFIPLALSQAVALAVEQSPALFEVAYV